MKQKTKKLLQLSFSLGFLATTALVATSCNDPKTVTSKPTKPNPMQPGNGSGSGTETTKPGTSETMQPGKGSGSGTGTTTDNTEAKNQLKALIDKENNNLALYADYSVIKSTLAQAYSNAKLVNEKTDATNNELTSAKTALETAINTAATSKTTFDKEHKELVEAYKGLKTKLVNKDSVLSMVDNDSYIKTYISNLYTEASNIVTAGLQPNTPPVVQDLKTLNETIQSSTSNLDQKKEVVNQYSNFKKFVISETNFKGDTLYDKVSPDTQSIVAFSSSFDNSPDDYKWRTARRFIDKEEKTKSLQETNVSWIYNLNTKAEEGKIQASYDIEFEYYSGNSAKLYFPYKAITTDQASSPTTKLSLNYKLNNSEVKSVDLTKAKVDGIEIAKIELTNLNFGLNKISFTTEADKSTPMIGNIYIANSDKNPADIYDDIFGNERAKDNPNQITVNFVKGYGLANKGIGVIKSNKKESTDIFKLTGKLDGQGSDKDYYLLGYLGHSYDSSSKNNATSQSSDKEKKYIFYVNVLKSGNYKISGFYNSGVSDRGLSFKKNDYNATGEGNIALYSLPMSGRWQDSIKSFSIQQKTGETSGMLSLTEGLNKIIVSGKVWNKEAPNLGNLLFTLNESQPTGSSMSTPDNSSNTHSNDQGNK
ncbi:Vmc-like lipoprotein signal peptide domain-containing protein [Mycoplasma bradburyae]|uniref:Vmc-like lipoprotein signal peptide domain-containing protein n=1 Tax=Mycoplasma bradburyae TaxID=2963128 RepID=UPI0020CB76C7|nr:hypothetical protein [Mycoplasma bradburyae]UTS70536.1 hypothetical protein NMG77_02165 [Mycoplasma bradburyae]